MSNPNQIFQVDKKGWLVYKVDKNILEQNLSKEITAISINVNIKQLHIVFQDGIHLYIVYNDYGEYSYSIIFSKLELDRCRFDNYMIVGIFLVAPTIFILGKKRTQLKAP